MILIFGIRLNRHTVGYVAESCPCCQKPTVCRLLELSRGDHLFFVPLGRGAFPLGHEARCLTCRKSFTVHALSYPVVGRSKKETVESLIPQTTPWLDPLISQDAAAESRFQCVLKVFMDCDHAFRDRRLRGGLQFDWVGVLALLAMIFVPLFLIGLVMSEKMPFLTPSQTVTMATVGSFAALFWGFYMIGTEDRRYCRKHLLPKLHAALDSLDARKADWEKACLRLKRMRFPIWKLMERELKVMEDEHPLPPMTSVPDVHQSVWTPPRAMLKARPGS